MSETALLTFYLINPINHLPQAPKENKSKESLKRYRQ